MAEDGTEERTDLTQLSNAELFELNQKFLNETIPDRPLIDVISPLTALRAEYESTGPDNAFVKQIDLLEQKGFHKIRRTRGDGDCFYRSLAFAYVDLILYSPEQEMAAVTAQSILEATLPVLEQAGFQRLVFEDFYEVLVTIIDGIITPDNKGEKLTGDTLLSAFQAPEVSNSVVVFLRLLTSAEIRRDYEAYAPFLLHPDFGIPMEPREFCENFVEATGKEADHVQITALAKALRVNLDIAYLDGRSSTNIEFVEFRGNDDGGESSNKLILLYRPGHYDILPPPETEFKS